MVIYKGRPLSGTAFLNVDLDIYSKGDLQPLLNSLARKVIVLYVGRDRRTYCAHLEVAKFAKTADSTIRKFCRLIQALPKRERDLWNRATIRSFSVGVQAGKQPISCDFPIQAKTVKAVSELAAQIVLTVYAPERSSERNDPS
jgi:hypothetical protein